MNEDLIAQAHWYADKIPAYGDYAKGAADILRKLADALEAAQTVGEPVAWVLWNTRDDEPVMLYTAEKPEGEFKNHLELRPVCFTGYMPQPAPQVPMTDDLAALVSRLARALGKASPQHELPIKAMRYLTEKDLLSGPWLRSKDFGATIEEFNAGLCAVEAHHKIGVNV